MALSALLAGAAQSDALENGAVVAYLRRLADYHVHPVVDENAPADGRPGVYLHSRYLPHYLAHYPRDEGKMEPRMQKVNEPVHEDGVEARIAQHPLDHTPRRRS